MWGSYEHDFFEDTNADYTSRHIELSPVYIAPDQKNLLHQAEE